MQLSIWYVKQSTLLDNFYTLRRCYVSNIYLCGDLGDRAPSCLQPRDRTLYRSCGWNSARSVVVSYFGRFIRSQLFVLSDSACASVVQQQLPYLSHFSSLKYTYRQMTVLHILNFVLAGRVFCFKWHADILILRLSFRLYLLWFHWCLTGLHGIWTVRYSWILSCRLL